MSVNTEKSLEQNAIIKREAFLLEKFQTFYKEEKFFDITLVAEIDKVKVKAHRIVISAWSDYFLALFSANLEEASADEIEIKDINGANLKTIVDCMYSTNINLSPETAEDILRAADYLQIRKLVSECCIFMEDHLDTSNCLGIAFFSERRNFKKLYRKSRQYAQRHFEAVRCEYEFLQLNEKQLRQYLASDNLCIISEESIFHSVLAWINFDEEIRADLAYELMSLVRFPLLTPKFIINNGKSIKHLPKCNDLIYSWLQWHLSPENRSKADSSLSKLRNENNIEFVVLGNSTRTLKIVYLENSKWSTLNTPPPLTDKTDCGVSFNNLKVVIAGGCAGLSVTNTVEYFSFKTHKWTALPPMNHKRKHPLVLQLDGDIYVIGGSDSTTKVLVGEKYDFFIGKWVQIAPFPYKYELLEGAVLNGLIYVIDILSSSMCSYDPLANTWRICRSKNKEIKYFGFAAGNRYLFAIGGDFHGGSSNCLDIYDPDSDSWRTSGILPKMQSHLKCLKMGQMILLIGRKNIPNDLDIVHAYDPISVSLKKLPSMPPLQLQKQNLKTPPSWFDIVMVFVSLIFIIFLIFTLFKNYDFTLKLCTESLNLFIKNLSLQIFQKINSMFKCLSATQDLRKLDYFEIFQKIVGCSLGL